MAKPIANRVLVFGDNSRAPYHPLQPVIEEFRSILTPLAAVTQTEDYDLFHQETVAAYDLILSYTDCWKESITDEQAGGLVRYVENGGVLLVIHNGVSLQVHPDLQKLIGVRYTGHPPLQSLIFHPSIESSDVLGLELPSFTLDEEPYQFEPLPDVELKPLLEYEWEGQRVPAGWLRSFGLGHVIYLAPGHHKPSFQVPAYREWIRVCADWLLRNR